MTSFDDRRILLTPIFAAVMALTASHALAQSSQPTMQDQVLNNLRQSPVGGHTLEALRLPEDYLRRVADRILRTSYEQQFRVVVPDGTGAAHAAELKPPAMPHHESAPAAGRSPWPALVTTALGICLMAAVVIAVQAVRARR
ncbi:MAG TPA: hypothetical protein VJZ71_12965 [Phycisphaerae bacterium]|nr:hypothetical protein [Phycisphaerae bacterium]